MSFDHKQYFILQIFNPIYLLYSYNVLLIKAMYQICCKATMEKKKKLKKVTENTIFYHQSLLFQTDKFTEDTLGG